MLTISSLSPQLLKLWGNNTRQEVWLGLEKSPNKLEFHWSDGSNYNYEFFGSGKIHVNE